MNKSWKLLAVIGCVSCCFFAVVAKSESELSEAKLGDGNDGNRTTPVHLCELFTRVYADDEREKVILDGEDAVQPFTTTETCGECHTIESISAGWHFNSSHADVPPGRPGEPWVLVDRFARTQIPVSGRGWPGTFKPEQIGLTPWQMVKNFGRHMPGGDYGEIIDQQDDGLDRIDVSGKFEINCLACHNADRRQDQSEAALQVARENLRWVSAAGSGLAVVSGLASTMDDFWDPREKAFSDNPSQMPPKVDYDKSRFDDKGRVFFDITRKVPANRCYFCHSVEQVSDETLEPWEQDQDVHLAAGLSCVDCHRHGENHMISRGYEDADTAVAEGKKATVASLTCAGCHLGSEDNQADGGRLGAPRPEHKGIPTVHFDKLTCTACHSGSKPAAQAGSVRTSRIHWLGLHGKHHLDTYQPQIAATVMTKRQDGKIGPARMMWPAFWARMKDEQVTPIEPEQVRKVAGDALKAGDSEKHLPEISREQIAQVLTLLQGQCAEGEQAVYVAGGRLYQLDGETVTAKEHSVAQPYSWALAHDVRPAQQSLGARSCTDCHAKDAPFFIGKVAVDSPVAGDADRQLLMSNFLGPLEPEYPRINRFFKWLIVIIMSLLILHIMGDLFRRVMNRIFH